MTHTHHYLIVGSVYWQTTGKIYTFILNAGVINNLKSRKLINDEQYGFREGKSCNQHLYN